MAKRILATDQGDTDEEDLDSDGWQSDYEAMMQALGDWGWMNVFVLSQTNPIARWWNCLYFLSFLPNIEGNVCLEQGVMSQPSHVMG